MKRILLVDADSVLPNIPLMKISSWHKNRGDKVTLVRVHLPYYPDRKKHHFTAPIGYDKTYCSVVFEGNRQFIHGTDIIFGGTGVDLTTVLPPRIEALPPDYSIYPENDTSYGFLTRGCIRKCSFCKVPQKEGYIHQVATVDDIVQHRKVKFFDNNILAYKDHKSILQELISKRIRCQFNQGLDIRLIDEENSLLLSNLRYLKEYIFAFDSWKYRKLIERKMKLLTWRKEWGFKFFIYVHPQMLLHSIIQRILWCKQNYCLPYIMRDIKCWDSPRKDFFTDIASYCNQVHVFKSMNFSTFLKKRTANKKRILTSRELWRVGEQ